MQEVTIKEVKLPKTAKSPVVLITTDDAHISGFAEKELAGLKDVKPGAVLMVDLEVKGKYTNITAFETVKPGSGEATPDSGYKADPAKLASEELRSRMHAAKDLWAAGKLQDGDHEVKLLRSWIMGHEAPQTAPQPRQPASKEKADVSDLRNLPIKNLGDLFTACLKYFKLNQAAVLKELGGITKEQISDAKDAWLQIVTTRE